MSVDVVDPYRMYPWRLLGYSNALLRPLRYSIPKPVYQLSLGLMQTYFIANSFDYANRIDSKNMLRSAFDCYTWHCAASWVGPALLMDNLRRLCVRYSSNKILPVGVAYAGLCLAGPFMDKAMDWYFYGFWSAGHKSKPRLTL